MAGKAPGATNRLNTYFTSKVLVCFQRRPGTEASKVIADAGSGTLTLPGVPAIAIEPVKGIYSLPIKLNMQGTFEILGTRFSVTYLDAASRESISRPSIVGWKTPLPAIGSLADVQRRLQIMGYYTGRVDGLMGELTERAVLEFQADEGSLLIDGDPGPKTKAALGSYFNANALDAAKKTHIVRRYFLSFRRPIVGPTKWDCPHPDRRGGGNTVVSFGVERTSVVSWLLSFLGLQGDDRRVFKVGLSFENVAAMAGKLFPKVDPGGAQVVDVVPGVNPAPAIPLYVRAKSKGKAKVELRHGSTSGPNIGELDVRIEEIQQVNVAIHVMDVRDNAGNAAANLWTVDTAKALVANVNEIWLPLGVEFRVTRTYAHRFVGRTAGCITSHFADNPQEWYAVWGAHNESNQLNAYFVNQLPSVEQDALGNPLPPSYDTLGFAVSRGAMNAAGLPDGHIGVCVRHDAHASNLAQTVAHELGHVLNLTRHANSHSDDDGTPTPFRHDIWSRSRLMAKYSQYDRTSPNRKWHDTGYGQQGNYVQCGSWLTVKKLGNDGTDNELADARGAAANPY